MEYIIGAILAMIVLIIVGLILERNYMIKLTVMRIGNLIL